MRHPTLLLACALLAALSAFPIALASAEAPAAPTPSPAFVPGRVIVQWEADADRSDKVEGREGAGTTLQANLGDAAFQLLEVDPGQSVAAAIEDLRDNPAVVVAERDSYSAPAALPDDPLLGQEWGLRNLGTGIAGFSSALAGADIDAAGAWAHNVGIPGVVVADIDSGYRFDSPDLGPVAWENPGETPANGIDDDGNGYVDDIHGYDFVGESAAFPEDDADPTDDDLLSGGHGVHTAGTIGAAGNDGTGITGVAQNARIMPLRVCAYMGSVGESRCPTSSIIAAINYAGANGARVANLSLSGKTNSSAQRNAFAENPGTLFVVSAGNDNQDNDVVPHYPCNYNPGETFVEGAIENLICVAATDQADQLASFSDWGEETVDLSAPGTEILSTYPALEDRLGEDFEQEDFELKWTASGTGGGFARTDEAPLTSFGMGDSPGATPSPGSIRTSTSTAVTVPADYGGCKFSGRRFVALEGGVFNQTVFSDGFSVFNSNPASTTGGSMSAFSTVPIEGLAGTSVRIRFRYTAGAAPSATAGVWLDDLKLTCYKPLATPPVYAFLQGTSMAAPHVSGAAALLFSQKPAATVEEVREALLASVDKLDSLEGLTVSGGRLDAARALDYLEPPAPQLTATNPTSPAKENSPRILGSAVGRELWIFAKPDCEGSTVKTGTPAELASPGILVDVPAETTIQFSALAKTRFNTSPCSAPISYTNSTDETAPGPPLLSSTDPASPADENNPKLVGSAEAGASIAVYSGPSCEGSPVASGTAAALASPGIAVSVADDSVSEFSATATDAALNTSGCSESIAYAEITPVPDLEAPSPPVLATSPVSPAKDWFPIVIGDAEPGSTVRLYGGSACAGTPIASGSAAQLQSPGFQVTVRAETTAQFSATATDAALNVSDCSQPVTYTNIATIGASTVTVIAPPGEMGPPAPTCTVPKLAGRTLAQARSTLTAAGCTLGKVTKSKPKKGQKLIVKGSTPGAGSSSTVPVALKLGPKPKAHRH